MYLEIVNSNVYLKENLHDFNYTKVINKKIDYLIKSFIYTRTKKF